MRIPTLLFLVVLLTGLSGTARIPPRRPSQDLQTWRRTPDGFEADPGCTDSPQRVGSLQKPFVAKAWAQAHPGEPSPRFLCPADSGCWLPSGHGELDLTGALAQSCNSYFRQLAAATPPGLLAEALAGEGFQGAGLPTPETAIGLGAQAPAIRPGRLLDSYRRLTREPWPAGEPIRQEVLAGLRQAALTGTAARLGQRGYWAKTGTVPVPGDPLHTSGLVVAVDDAGWAILARLASGTGAEAAAALAGPLKRLRPWATASRPRPPSGSGGVRSPGRNADPGSPEPAPSEAGPVTIRLLDLLSPGPVFIRNAGSAPVPLRRGFLGAGARLRLVPGDRVGPGLLEVEAPGHGLLRRIEGTLACGPGSRLVATVTRREYVSGILEGELSRTSPLRLELGAAVLRFLDQPPRHRDAQVCDSTHCAWFVGRGPRLDWTDPGHARVRPEPPGPWGFTDAEWVRVLEAARQPGPKLWTTHCGGQPLSPRALWGRGEGEAKPCPRHGPGQTRPWERTWKAPDLATAFGEPVTKVAVAWEAGVWNLQVTGPRGLRGLRYDEAHRRLARALGWEALPSPADAVEPVPGGWRARGVGSGHRVGLCLGD